MNISPTPESPSVLWPKIERVNVGMFTTVDEHGQLISRPMMNQQVDQSGFLWFFTSDESKVSHNIAVQPGVNVSYADHDENLYVSVTGHAEQIKDHDKIRELWNPLISAWFPQGIDDPHLILIKVTIESAEYWDLDPGKALQLFKLAKAAITGKPPEEEPSEHGKINL